MPLVLTVLHGQAQGDLVITAARSPALVGRSPMCGVVLDDGYVSDSHAAIYFDATGARIRDLGSQTGTWVNGAGVQQHESPLRTGDRVQIGQTMFSVEVVEESAAAAPQDDALTALVSTFQTTPRDCARFALRAEAAPLFALIDLADDPELFELLNESGEEFCALDETVEPDALGETAPFLVAFSKGSVFLGEVVEGVWGNGQAVFLASDAPFAEVYAHLLRQIEQNDDGEIIGPQLWRPDMLAEVLTEFTGEGAAEFFGPVRAFLAESDDASALARWTMGREGLTSERVELAMPGAS